MMSLLPVRRLSLVVPFALSALLAGCGESTEVEYTFEVSQANPLDTEEEALVAAVNARRADAGVGAVKACFSLNVSASAHADDMRDNSYLSDVDLGGGTMRDRACAAGYDAACEGAIPMAELIVSGTNDAQETLGQWVGQHDDFLTDPAFVVVGAGRSLGGQAPYWTLDLASVDDASCQGGS